MRPSFRGASGMPPEQADLHREQQSQRAIEGSLPSWLRSGKLVSVTLVDATETKAQHGLGRAAKGWFLGSVSGDADLVAIFQVASDQSTLTLSNRGATGTLSAQLWVF